MTILKRWPVLLSSVWMAVVSPAAGQLFDDGGPGSALLLSTTDPAESEPNTDPTKVAASVEASAIDGDGRFVLAVILDHPPKLHTWPSVEQDVLPPTLAEITVGTRTTITPSAEGVTFGPVQWPEPHLSTVPNLDFSDPDAPPTVEVPTYSGRAIAYIPARLDGERLDAVDITIFYQACDDTACYAPVTERLTAVIEPGVFDASGDFAGFETDRWSDLSSSSVGNGDESVDDSRAFDTKQAPATFVRGSSSRFLGFIPVPDPGSLGGLAVIGLLAALGGLVLNLTPCVLPVIPLKIMTLSQHASTPGKSLYLGSMMALGVVAFWGLLSIPAIAFQQFADPSRVFGIWWVTGGLGLLMVVMAAGLMGAFELTLPQAVYRVNPKADSGPGSFLFGIMTAVFGLPCFGLVVGPLLGASATTTSVMVVTIFTSIGVGMAAPYLILSVRPDLLKAVPKAGPGSLLVKQVLGLLLLAAAAYFVGAGTLGLLASEPYLGKVLHWWVVAAFLAAAGVWLVLRVVSVTKSIVARVLLIPVALLVAAGGFWYAQDTTKTQRAEYETVEAALAERDTARDAYIETLRGHNEQLAALLADPSRGEPLDGLDLELPEFSSLLTTVWNDYSPETLEEALDSDKVIVVDFTAEWCLNCKALKAAVLNKGAVKESLQADDTLAITVDLTADDAPGWAYLRELGRTGIPTLAIYGPGLDEPWISNAYTSQQVLGAIDRARGSTGPDTSVAAR
ncbi:MAG: thioredoxin family protein [Planctomycetota bacterium]